MHRKGGGMTPEQQARVGIDALLAAAGWHVCHLADVNLNAGTGPARGVAIREFPLLPGHGSGRKTARLRTMRRTGRFPIFLFLPS